MKIKILLSLLGFFTLISIGQGLSLRRSERIAEKFPVFELLNETAFDRNFKGNHTNVLNILKLNYQEKLKTLPRIIEDFIITIDNNDDDLSIKNSDVSPKNLILLFIQDDELNGDKIWNELKKSHIFPVQGFLQNCQNEKKFSRFPLEESMNSDDLLECDCQNFLQKNVRNLLGWSNWAKLIMSSDETKEKFKKIVETFGIFASLNLNSTIPPLLARESSIFRKVLFGEQSALENNWQLLDLTKEKTISHTFAGELTKFFSSFSMLRIAFYKKWLNSLFIGNEKNDEDLNGNLLELVKDTIGKIKSLSYDENFIFIAFSPVNELAEAIDYLKYRVSGFDTLLLVSGTCSRERKVVPFFARGPGSKYFHEANSIWDIPHLVKRVASDCKGNWCKMESTNEKLNLKKKVFKRTAKNEDSERRVESTTLVNNATNDEITNPSAKNEINNSTANNVSITVTTKIPELNSFSALENNVSGVNNSANLTEKSLENNISEIATTNRIDNKFMDLTTVESIKNNKTTKLRKVIIENNSTDVEKIIINDTKVTTNIVNDIKTTIEIKSTTETKSDEKIKIDNKINEQIEFKEENFMNNITNGKNESEKIAALSKASFFSKQTSTIVISVSTSFIALLLF
ncbi:uncharacterized protein LOC127280466 isoform X2 [Leptopilina boulardi]|uniref:uncharacterized protein LOC127280466 isoform X2 n=1 Tax=Leptopilina boulardi TaxID=63433 RepID=UPI0021F5172E|nr:uncharacterized protein LOC127280466 isoform X2 [Leptopilina boulardi]